MGRKRIRQSIADNPISMNLAWLLRHPDSGHPERHSLKGFKQELVNIHHWIKKNCDTRKNSFQITPYTVEHWITGYRFPLFDSLAKLCEAYNAIHGANYNPYDFYVDRRRWIESNKLTIGQFSICEAILSLKDPGSLDIVASVVKSCMKREAPDKPANSTACHQSFSVVPEPKG